MRNQIAAAEKLGIRAHTINSTNRDGWDEVQRAAGRRRRRPAADQPRAAQQPAVPARDAAACSPSASACSWSTRRTASRDWGHDFRPDYRRIAEMLERLPGGRRRALHDRDGQRPRRRRRRRAAAARARGGAEDLPRARSAASRLRLEVVELPAQADRLAWLATHLPDASRLGHRLHADQARRRHRRRVAQRPRHRRRGLQRRGRAPSSASRSRSACSPTTSRPSWPRARSAWATTSPTSASSCTTRRPARSSPTTSRSAAPAARSSAPRSCCCAAARTAGSRTSSSSRRSRREDRVDRVLEALERRRRRRRELMGAVNLGKSRIEAMLKVLDVEGAVHAQRARAGRACPAATGPTTASATRTSPRCAGASRRRWRPSAPTAAA